MRSAAARRPKESSEEKRRGTCVSRLERAMEAASLSEGDAAKTDDAAPRRVEAQSESSPLEDAKQSADLRGRQTDGDLPIPNKASLGEFPDSSAQPQADRQHASRTRLSRPRGVLGWARSFAEQLGTGLLVLLRFLFGGLWGWHFLTVGMLPQFLLRAFSVCFFCILLPFDLTRLPHLGKVALGQQRRDWVYRQLEILQRSDRTRTETVWRTHRSVCLELLEALQRRLCVEEGGESCSSVSLSEASRSIPADVEAAAAAAVGGDSRMASVLSDLPQEAVDAALQAARCLVKASRRERLEGRSSWRRVFSRVCRVCGVAVQFVCCCLAIMLFVDLPVSVAAAEALPKWFPPGVLAVVHAVVRGLVASSLMQLDCGEALVLLPLAKCGGAREGCVFHEALRRKSETQARVYGRFLWGVAFSVCASLVIGAAASAASAGEAWTLHELALAPLLFVEGICQTQNLSFLALLPLDTSALQLRVLRQNELGWIRLQMQPEQEPYFFLFLSAVATAAASGASRCRAPSLLWRVHARLEHAVAKGVAETLLQERREELRGASRWERMRRSAEWLVRIGCVRVRKGLAALAGRLVAVCVLLPLLVAWWGVVLLAVSDVPLVEREEGFATIREFAQQLREAPEVQQAVSEIEEFRNELLKRHRESGPAATLEWMGEFLAEAWSRHQSEVEEERTAQEEAWRLFELDPGASAAEIRARYKQLAKQFHPDRVSAAALQLGTAPSPNASATTDAETQMRKINLAYEALLKESGGRGAALREP